MRDPLDPPTWAKFLLIVSVAALLAVGIATFTAPTGDPATKPAAPVTSETWCRILHDTGSRLSCDWDDPELPARALEKYQTNPGISIETATINAAQENTK
ncbi:hypothetical protein [Varibaculum cambriense]|uniref:hypothetical protein n=1 Tax=Varibaculum cambriense TaxID=184870 RepID=UPI00241DB8C5|nr:hypothetical protein [Varibaculum cambriense]MBS5944894.1 hypothetical protein [Varibaculum cambriense]